MSLPSSSNIGKGHKVFNYSKNSKLLFIAGPFYIFENMHCHCCKKKNKTSKGKTEKVCLPKSYLILSKIKTSS